MMIDREVIGRLTPLARKGYASLMAAGACVILLMACLFGSIIFEEYRLDARYAREGVHVDGVITGFRHFQATGKGADRFTGYYPDVSFATPNGPVTLKASAGTPFSAQQQGELVGRKVAVVYLPDQPQRARVIEWPDRLSASTWMVFLLCSAVSLFVLYCAGVMWPRAGTSKISH